MFDKLIQNKIMTLQQPLCFWDTVKDAHFEKEKHP